MSAAYPCCPTCGHEFTSKPRIDAMIAALGLVGTQKRLLTILASARGRYLTIKEIVHVLYDDRADGGPETAENTVRVTILRLRERLLEYGLQIDGFRAHGGGYRLWTIESPTQTQCGGGYQLVEAA